MAKKSRDTGSDDLPHETENTVYRYLIAISKLRLGILTEQAGAGDAELVLSLRLIYLSIIYLFRYVRVVSDRAGGLHPLATRLFQAQASYVAGSPAPRAPLFRLAFFLEPIGR